MELRHLRYFVAVAEEQNVTRAAARLHISQPPLTRQIHDLEQELGFALFDRGGRSIRLNRAGQVFLEAARKILDAVDRGVDAARAAASELEGELHVGYAPSPSIEILPALLREFQSRQPRVRVVLHDHSAPEMLAGLREGRLEAAIMMQHSARKSRGILFEKLRSYPVNAAVAPNHPLARRRAVSIADLRAEPLVVYARKLFPDYHDFVASVMGMRPKKLRIAGECDSGSSLIAALESGTGVSVCASVFSATAGKRLKFVPIHPAPKPAVVGIAYGRASLGPAGKAFVAVAKLLPGSSSDSDA